MLMQKLPGIKPVHPALSWLPPFKTDAFFLQAELQAVHHLQQIAVPVLYHIGFFAVAVIINPDAGLDPQMVFLSPGIR